MSWLDQFKEKVSEVKGKINSTLNSKKKENKELEDLARKMLDLSQQGLINANGNKGMEMIFEQIAGEARKVLGVEAPKHLTSPEPASGEEKAEKVVNTVEAPVVSTGFKAPDAEEADFEEVYEEPVKRNTIFERVDESERITAEGMAYRTESIKELRIKEEMAEKNAKKSSKLKSEEKNEVSYQNEVASEEVLHSNEQSVSDTAISEEATPELPQTVDPVSSAAEEPSKTEWINSIISEVQQKENNIDAIANAVAAAVRDAIAGKDKHEPEKSSEELRKTEEKTDVAAEAPETVQKEEKQPIVEDVEKTVEVEPVQEESEAVAEETKPITEPVETVQEEKSEAAEEMKEEVPVEEALPKKETAAEKDDDQKDAVKDETPEKAEAEPDVLPEEAAEPEPEPEPEPQIIIDPTLFVGKKVIYACSQKGGDPVILQCFKDWQIDYQEANNGLKTVETFSGSEPGTFDGAIFEKNLFLMDAVTVTKCIRKLKHPDAGVPVGVIAVGSAVSETLFEQAGITAWTTENTPEALFVMMQKMFMPMEETTETESEN